MSLHDLARLLSSLDQRQAALVAAEEATPLFRALAAAQPEALALNLSVALFALADLRGSGGDPTGGRAAIAEAIMTITPDFLASPLDLEHYMAKYIERYAELGEALGVDFDTALVGQILEALQKLENERHG